MSNENQFRYILTTKLIKRKMSHLELFETWSEKYKRSIDCKNPKGFSQRAHCAGRKKRLRMKIKSFESWVIENYNSKNGNIEQLLYECVEGVDNKYSCIAAASILAKVERDNYIDELCNQNPELVEHYSLDTNKGYGAKKHLEGIQKHGITIWHRRSFGICKQYA